MNTNPSNLGIRDTMLLTGYVAILLTMYVCNDLVAVICTVAVLILLKYYAHRFAVIRRSGLYLGLGALAGYIFCEIFFRVPFFFASPRLGLICFCMTIGGSIGIVLHAAKFIAQKTSSK